MGAAMAAALTGAVAGDAGAAAGEVGAGALRRRQAELPPHVWAAMPRRRRKEWLHVHNRGPF